MTQPKMPGPKSLEALKLAPRFAKNYLDPMVSLFHKYGDYVALGDMFVFAYHPDAVEHILKTNMKNFRKTEDMDGLKPVLGDGLLTSEGDLWKEHRRVIAPEFQNKRMEGFYVSIERHTRALIKEWRGLEGDVNVAPLVAKTTYAIAGECFFGAEVEASAATVYRAIDVSSRVAIRRMSSGIKLPMWVPTPGHLRMGRAIADLNKVVYEIIAARRGNEEGRTDLLSRMLSLKLGEKEIRDEVMTMLLAGHETTSNAIAWTLYLLAQHPEEQARLRDELNAKTAGETPTNAELKLLDYTRMVFEESMRMYPPAGVIGRKALADDVLCGYPIKAGTRIQLVQWVTHRHPQFWDEPNRFRPERFASPLKHQFAYFPFAFGPRECVGKNLAMLEGIGLLAGIVKNFRFEIAPGSPVTKPLPLITVRPDPGVFLKLTKL